MTKNQCDGCLSGMPIKDGIHYDGRYPLMYCQAYRYRRPASQTAPTTTKRKGK